MIFANEADSGDRTSLVVDEIGLARDFTSPLNEAPLLRYSAPPVREQSLTNLTGLTIRPVTLIERAQEQPPDFAPGRVAGMQELGAATLDAWRYRDIERATPETFFGSAPRDGAGFGARSTGPAQPTTLGRMLGAIQEPEPLAPRASPLKDADSPLGASLPRWAPLAAVALALLVLT